MNMGKKYFLIITCVIALGVFFSFNIIANRNANGPGYSDSIEELDMNNFHAKLNGSEGKREAIYKTLYGLLSQGHYSPKEIDDMFSEKVFNDFLERMDYGKSFFLQSDIDKFQAYKYQIDDEIEKGESDFFQTVHTTYTKRSKEAEEAFKSFGKTVFDFTKDEEIELDGKKLSWAKNKTELRERWLKNLKYRVLSRYNELLKDEKNKGKSKKELQEEAFTSVKKSTDYYYRRMKKFGEKEQFAFYLNAITLAFDPHTTYLAPKDKKRFDEEMSGTFFGIGAVLSMKENICEISQIISGAPCWKQGSLKVGDGILKVAQGSEEPKDVVGWDLEDIVNIIRGKKGTEVRLTVKHLDGSQEIIPIIRDKVEVEQTFAKSIIIKEKNNKIGLISLPSFYANFNDFDGRRSSTDMKKEIEKLKGEGVDGIIIDLRNNGGGSLGDVVDIAGYFIEDGPVVQVRSRGRRPQVMPDRDPSVLYNGPLAILINSNSASASEILAAAMQDYKRAIILGSTSFGKGTVQRIVNLDDYFQGNKENLPLGNLKITTQKFYRVNGGSTQLKGVEPDISIPSTFEFLDLGERKDDNAMEWDQIAKADYDSYELDYSKLIAKSKARIKADKKFNLILKSAKQLKEQRDNNRYSLNLPKYQNQLLQAEKDSKAYEKLQKSGAKLTLANISAVEKVVQKDTIEKRKNNDWKKILEKDPYITEAVNVLNDWISTLPRELTVK